MSRTRFLPILVGAAVAIACEAWFSAARLAESSGPAKPLPSRVLDGGTASVVHSGSKKPFGSLTVGRADSGVMATDLFGTTRPRSAPQDLQIRVRLQNAGGAHRTNPLELSGLHQIPAEDWMQKLRARQFKLDGDLYTLLYVLNPDVKDLKKLPPGAVLNIPPGLDLQGMDDPSAQFKVELEPENKHLVIDGINSFRRKLTPAAGLPGPLDPKLTREVDDQLRAIRDSILNESRPFSPSHLHFLSRLLPVLDSKLAKSDSASLTRYLRGVVSDLADILDSLDEIKADEVPGRWREVRVKVRTKRGSSEIPGLTVHFVPEAFEDVEAEYSTFQQESSPTEPQTFPEGRLVFWATRGSGSKPVTERRKVKLRATDAEQAIDLTLTSTVP